ncbi:MAG: hypothetical protein EOO05_10705 [Chitinophagaceae bacterium]|nr:MAG: hypothetical protein EOO05_10705 [Chitinophagaceae bacterium]
MNSCIIDNAYDAGLLAVNSSIRASNLLVSNSGKNIVISKGGRYEFTNCSFVGYSSRFIGHLYPVLDISNSDGTATAALEASFNNCIFWGDKGVVDNEVVIEKTGSDPFSVIFDHVLWRQATSPAFATLANIIENQDPLFANTDPANGNYNFRLAEGSPAVNTGKTVALATDLDGRPRSAGVPDLGAYEQ